MAITFVFSATVPSPYGQWVYSYKSYAGSRSGASEWSSVGFQYLMRVSWYELSLKADIAKSCFVYGVRIYLGGTTVIFFELSTSIASGSSVWLAV